MRLYRMSNLTVAIAAKILVLLCSAYSAAANMEPAEQVFHLNHRFGIITSPGYPQNYTNNLKLRWIISSSVPLRFLLNLTSYDIENSVGCKNDYLIASRQYLGRTHGLHPMVCDSVRRLNNRTIVWDSVSYQMEVEFSSDRSVTSSGFYMEYETSDVQPAEICRQLRGGGPIQGRISSESLGDNTRYPPNLNCSWNVNVFRGMELHINVKRFHMEYLGNSCEADSFSIYTIGVNAEGDKHIGKFCGKRVPWKMVVRDSRLAMLNVKTDDSDNLGGFVIEYFQRPIERNGFVGGPLHKRVSGKENGKFPTPVSWLYSGADKGTFSWHLRADPGYRIRIRVGFHSLNVSGDIRAELYDGPTDSFTDKYSYDLKQFSVDRASSGFHVVVKVVLNEGSNLRYLNMTYETFNFFLTSDIVFRYLDIGDYTIIQNPSQIFRCCVYHAIVAQHGQAVAFDLRDLGLFSNQGNDDDCSNAGVVVFDGGFSANQTIGPVCDTTSNRIYDIFNNFVSSSSTIFVFLYGYTNGPGRTNHIYELEPWPTTCTVRHITNAFLSRNTSEDKAVTTQATPRDEQEIINIDINPSESCFLLYIHPLKHEEPFVKFTVKGNKTATLCERWALKSVTNKNNEKLLPIDSSKYSKQWTCDRRGNTTSDGNKVYVLSGYTNATWSQRIGRLTVGDTDAHICGKVPEYESQNQVVLPTAPCGTITHTDSELTWSLQDSTDTKPFYWVLEILFLSINPVFDPRSCYLDVHEIIRGGKTPMQTRFMCVELNKGRVRRYRTMEPNSYMRLSNKKTRAFKIRYAKRYIISPEITPVDAATVEETNATCPNSSVRFENHCYDFQRASGKLSWQEAEKACAKKGGDLLSILNIQELNFIKNALVTTWNDGFFNPPLGLLFIGLTDKIQPESYRWTDGNPLSVTDWFHRWDIDNNILPYKPALPINPKLTQPVGERNKRCVAMAVGNIYYSTNWIKIACFKSYYKPSFICKRSPLGNRTYNANNLLRPSSDPSGYWENVSQIDTTFDYQYKMGHDPGLKSLNACPQNWTFIQGGCYILVSEDIPLYKSTPMWKAIPLCVEMGGNIAFRSNLSSDTLLYYLTVWGVNPGDGNIWLRVNSGEIGCTSVSTLQQEVEGAYVQDSSTNCIVNEGRVGYVLCETEIITLPRTCEKHQYMCHDGTCLHETNTCDGKKDCHDGEDEQTCGVLMDDLFYTCADNTIISASDVCDFWSDCADGSDEVGCQHRPCTSEEFRCRNKQCISQEHKCDFISHCLDGSDEDSCDWGVEVCKGFECPGGMCLPVSRVTDLVSDCPDGSEADEMSDHHYRLEFYVVDNGRPEIKRDNSAWCPGTNLYRRCHRDRVTCFNRADVCSYNQDNLGDTMHCRDGVHLKDCERYQCPHMFKCPKSYCIPWYKVCDGVKDCVGGADERNCQQYSCPGKLRCKGSYQCVTQEQICDGRVHCRGSWSDEQFCDLSTWSCPSGCQCKGYAVDCSNNNLTDVPTILANTRILLLQENELVLTNSSFTGLSYLSVLRLAKNSIANIPYGCFSDLKNVHTLDLRYNSITLLYAKLFDGLVMLRELLLDGNYLRILPAQGFSGLTSLNFLNLSRLGIETVKTGAFGDLPRLSKLDLSYNNINVLESDFIPHSYRVNSIYLTGNDLDKTSDNIFRTVTTKQLHTDSFRFCCFVDPSLVDECQPRSDVFSSCEDLLSTVILRAIVWFLGIACVLGNTMVIVWRVYSGFHNRPAVYVLHLSISDMFMGVYLIILASTDVYYRGNYILHDQTWRQGGVCQLLGILTTVSCQMSMFTLLTLAWDRFLAVKFPFSVTLHTTRGAWIIMVILWVFSLALALFPLAIQQHLDNFYGKNSICMPFNFTNPKLSGWEYATVVFVGLNGLCIAVIVALYAAIYCSVHDSQLNAGRKDRSDLVVARRLSIVLITNIISWIPIILANIISVTAGPLTREMAAILTTVILPLNPTINPYLYTFSSCVKRDHKKPPQKSVTEGKTYITHL